jgi:hypothetical protein
MQVGADIQASAEGLEPDQVTLLAKEFNGRAKFLGDRQGARELGGFFWSQAVARFCMLFLGPLMHSARRKRIYGLGTKPSHLHHISAPCCYCYSNHRWMAGAAGADAAAAAVQAVAVAMLRCGLLASTLAYGCCSHVFVRLHHSALSFCTIPHCPLHH